MITHKERKSLLGVGKLEAIKFGLFILKDFLNESKHEPLINFIEEWLNSKNRFRKIDKIRKYQEIYSDYSSVWTFLNAMISRNETKSELFCFSLINYSILNKNEYETYAMSLHSTSNVKFNFKIETIEDLSVFFDFAQDNEIDLITNNKLNLPNNYEVMSENNYSLAEKCFARLWLVNYIKRLFIF